MTTVSAPAAPETEYGQATISDWLGSVAHAFLWYGNVGDYAAANETVPDYAVRLLVQNGIQSVAQFSVDRGITFPLSRFAEDFVRVTGALAKPEEIAQTGVRGKNEDLVPWLTRFLAEARACTSCERTVKPATDAEIVAYVASMSASPDAQAYLAQARAGICVECLNDGKVASNPDAAQRQVATVIIEGMDLLCPPANKGHMDESQRAVLGMLRRVGTDVDLTNSGNPIIMLAPSQEEVHGDLLKESACIGKIEVPLPNFARRLEFIQDKLAGAKDITLEEGLDARGIAALTSSMELVHIEDVFLRARRNPGKVLTKRLIKQRKADAIKSESGGMLRIVEPQGGFDRLGGMGYFLTWEQLQLKLLRHPDAQVRAKAYATVLLNGAPGLAKTDLAYAVAYELDWNCYEYGEVRSSEYGATQERTTKAHMMVEAGLPAVLVLDEVDQMGGRVGSGSPGGAAEAAEAEVFRSRLQFIEDMAKRHPGEILIYATSNRPDLIDDAMNSRFQVRAPILYPTGTDEIADVLYAIVVRNGYEVGREDLFPLSTRLAKNSVPWAGRDMVQTFIKAQQYMEAENLELVAALEKAFATRKPMAREDAMEMQKLAIAECNDLDLLPQQARAELEQIDKDELRSKITELRRRNERAPRG